MAKNFTIKDVNKLYMILKAEMGKVIKGQNEVIDNLIICLFSGGHILIEGVPGLGKTLLANTLSYIVGGEFK